MRNYQDFRTAVEAVAFAVRNRNAWIYWHCVASGRHAFPFRVVWS